jgi:ribokinase
VATGSEAARPRIGVIGDIALDYYLVLAPRHGADEKRAAVRSLRLPGGTGANTAAAAAALGSQVTLYSAVGTDQTGDWLIESAAARGVGTKGIRRWEGASTQATIVVDAGTRQVIVDPGVAGELARLVPEQIGAADIVYVTCSSEAIRRVAGSGIRSRVIAGIEAGMVDDDHMKGALRNVELVITNSAGWAPLRGPAAGAVTVIETRGSRGAVIHDPAAPDEHIPGLAVEAADATGAGDCFAGALCHYLGCGLGLAEASRLAVAAAGLSTRALGAQSALPTDSEVRAAAARQAASIAGLGAAR